MGEDNTDNGMHGAEPSIEERLTGAGFRLPRISYAGDKLIIRNKEGSEIAFDESELDDVLNGLSVIDDGAARLIKRWYRISSKKLMDMYNALDNLRDLASTPLEKRQIWFEMGKIGARLADSDRKKAEIGFCYNTDGANLDKLYNILMHNTCESFNIGSFRVDVPLKYCGQIISGGYQPKADILTADDFFKDLKNTHGLLASIKGMTILGSDGTPYDSAAACAMGRHLFFAGETPVCLEARISRNGGSTDAYIKIEGAGLSEAQFNSAMRKLPDYKGNAGTYGTEDDSAICIYDDETGLRKILLKGPIELLQRDTLKIINHLLSYHDSD